MIHSAIAGKIRLGSKRGDGTHANTGREKPVRPAATAATTIAKTITEKVQTNPRANASPREEKPLDKVMRSFKEAVEISQQVTNTLKEMTTATENQTRNIEEVSTTIQSISSAIQQTALSASKAMEKAVGSDSIAKSASRDAERGMQKMSEVKETILRSSASVKSLGDELKKINEIVKLITAIADKTNLLALNAAIEAARAGDAGKGFAVVADEVKRLAESSRKGANEISKIVKHLEESSKATIGSIEHGNTSIIESYDVITKVLQSLQEIAGAVSEVVSQMGEISASAEQVAASSEQAAASSEEISSVAQQNLADLKKITESNNNDDSSVIEAIVKDASKAAETLADITGIMDKSNIISITDTEGAITYINDKFLEVARYRPEELMDQNHRILKSGFHAPELFEAMWQTISDGRPFSGYVRNRAKDGTVYWVKAVVSPVTDHHGEITGYVSVRAPVTELMVMF
uniref:methyl-accepting chemotaxis protein n=1 Tax=Nitrososphaera sp. TaxID=1971748 RepID=UPI00307F7925